MRGTPRGRPWIILSAIFLHIAWGVALIIDPDVAPLIILVGLHWISAVIPDGLFSGVSDGQVLGGLLIGVSLLAALGLALGERLSNTAAVALLLPQQFLLVSALFSDVQTVLTGRVVGQPRELDRVLLFTILSQVMIVALLHTFALIERHSRWTRAS